MIDSSIFWRRTIKIDYNVSMLDCFWEKKML